MTFADLPIGATFYFVGDPEHVLTIKTGADTAVDGYCARGFCFSVQPHETVIPATRKELSNA
jgi:hypothetical protein